MYTPKELADKNVAGTNLIVSGTYTLCLNHQCDDVKYVLLFLFIAGVVYGIFSIVSYIMYRRQSNQKGIKMKKNYSYAELNTPRDSLELTPTKVSTIGEHHNMMENNFPLFSDGDTKDT